MMRHAGEDKQWYSDDYPSGFTLTKKIYDNWWYIRNDNQAKRRKPHSSNLKKTKGFATNVVTVEAVKSQQRSELTMEKLNDAMVLQQNLSEISELINISFRPQLLLIVLEAFLSITFNCYYLLYVAFSPSNFRLPPRQAVFFLLYHLIQPCANLLGIVIAFRMVRNSFPSIQKIVNKLILFTEDDKLQSRLSQFSMQIQTNTPVFTIYGLFPLDGSLIYSIVAATTTYLIILIQYSEDDADDESTNSTMNATLT